MSRAAAGSANLVMTHRDRAKYSSKHLLQQTEQVNTVMRPFITTGHVSSGRCNHITEDLWHTTPPHHRQEVCCCCDECSRSAVKGRQGELIGFRPGGSTDLWAGSTCSKAAAFGGQPVRVRESFRSWRLQGGVEAMSHICFTLRDKYVKNHNPHPTPLFLNRKEIDR